jgi:ParB-like chromosome segregation protein Spo0J
MQPLQSLLADAPDKAAFIEEVKSFLYENSPFKSHPVDFVRWIPVDDIVANDYNPNSVAKTEMQLLYTSIEHDGFTQPVVVVYDPERKKYVVVDGFHRYTTVRLNSDISERTHRRVPCVVLKKDISERMAATVRHNRARGKHSIAGMSNIVFGMLDQGMSDAEICQNLGMEPDELVRLKHLTGFSKLFENVEYRKAWETARMMRLRKTHQDTTGEPSIYDETPDPKNQ